MNMGSDSGMIRPHEGRIDFTARTADAATIALALGGAAFAYPQPWDNRHSTAASVAVVVFYIVAQANGLYRPWRSEPLRKELLKLWVTWSSVVPLLLMIAFVSKVSEDYSRQVVLSWFVATPILQSFFRVAARLSLQEARSRGMNSRTVAIVGASKLGESLARSMQASTWMGLRVVGFFDDRHPSRLHPVDPDVGALAGDFDNLLERAKNGLVDVVYIALPLRAEPRINSYIRRLSDTTASVYVAYDFGGFDILRAQWGAVGDVPVMSVVENPFHGVDGFTKRVEDLLVGSLIMLLIAIPMLAISIGVKLSSPGPVFFRQRRYGLNGEELRVFKFRSMRVMEDGEEVKQATKGDARITPFGGFLRRTSLDELPQFLQVLSGEMSIVGPRPHAVLHNEQYRSLIQGYMLRHKVKPGITGWAQVNGWRGETDTLDKMEKRVEFDLAYIRNWGLLWDLKIIWMTVFGGMGGRNAY